MGLRRLRLGAIEVLVAFPEGFGRRVRTLGGILPEKTAPERNLPIQEPSSSEARTLLQKVNRIEWYHTIELAHGVVTPGWFDLRPLLHEYPLPERMDGMRVLDVATFDGFWAFEFERRGAAEVVALDIDCFGEVDMAPRIRRRRDSAYLARRTGEGFALCHEIFGSKVKREVLNIYDLAPERLGRFDMVFLSDLLLHLRNPMQALDNLCSVTSGTALVCDVYDARLPGTLMNYEGGVVHNTWWSISRGALEQMLYDAGFSQVTLRNTFLTGYRGQKPTLSHAAFECKP